MSPNNDQPAAEELEYDIKMETRGRRKSGIFAMDKKSFDKKTFDTKAFDSAETKEETEGTRRRSGSGVFSTGTARSTGFPFWIVDDHAYDFSEFQKIHPGGKKWFEMSERRDISILFHTNHLNPKKIMPILKKYKISKDHKHYDECVHLNLLPKLGAPPFLFPEEFDARTDLHTFDFHNEGHLLNTLRKTVQQPAFQAKIKEANRLFDICCFISLFIYAIITAAFLFDALYIPTWICVVSYVLLRTAFGAFGHYYVHAKKPNILEVLFDCNYVGASIAFDGHVMLHHAYTHTGGDVKTMFFSGMWTLPHLYRPIAYTFHKLGAAFSGVLIRVTEIIFVEWHMSLFNPAVWGQKINPAVWLTRLFMISEFCISYSNGKFIPFMIQFALSLWFNTFLVLSSHDFEEFYDDPTGGYDPDWAVFQINNCHDMTLLGNKYIDIFLSAGLSSHRAHHLFPYQTSGFANILTEEPIRKILPDFGLKWHRPKVFWTERVPYVFQFCFMHPTVGMEGMSFLSQHLSISGIANTVKFILTGFLGINAV